MDGLSVMRGAPGVLGFRHPFSALVVGPSDAGKTTLILKIIENRHDVIVGHIRHFFWCLPEDAVVSPAVLQSKTKFEIVRGLPRVQDIPFDSLVVVDDMDQNAQSPEIANFFKVHSHHKRISLFLVLHNLFIKSPVSRDIALNAKFTIFLRQPRSPASFLHYCTQTLGKRGAQSLYQAYLEHMKKPYAYVICDNTQQCPSALRFRSQIFPGEEGAIIFSAAEDLRELVRTKS